jgi:hypothetical protein
MCDQIQFTQTSLLVAQVFRAIGGAVLHLRISLLVLMAHHADLARQTRAWLGGGNRSRPSSPSGENRLSLTLSRLTGRGSKDKLVINTETPAADDHTIVVDDAHGSDKDAYSHSPAKEKKEKDAGQVASKSKKEKKDKARSKSKEPGEILEKGKHKEKNRPDRECVVM